MAVKQEFFEKTKDGQDVYLYTLENKNGMKAEIINFGAVLLRLFVPNKKGEIADVVEGYDCLENYYSNPGNFGATIGPSANRIGDAKFEIDGETYHIQMNDGPNNLHSHFDLGFQKRVWTATVGDNSVTLRTSCKDGEMGFPGNIKASITYSLNDDNELELSYHAVSDKKTIINLTNHSYFNLKGSGSGTIEDNIMWIRASHYTDVREGAICTGEIKSVKGTPLDFTSPKRVGDEIDADFGPINIAGGYDHNFVIDNYDGTVQLVARVEDKEAERTMEVYTDLPGIQFYAGNGTSTHPGKDGSTLKKRSSLCLETQYFPNSANIPSFPSCIFGPDREYYSNTIYKFI